MKKTFYAIIFTASALGLLTGCGEKKTDNLNSKKETEPEIKETYSFNNLKKDLKTLDKDLEENKKAASLVGAEEGYGYIMNNCTIEVYKYDKNSVEYKNAEKTQKLSIPDFDMTIDAKVKNGYAYFQVDEGSCEKALEYANKLK